jgi:hypothetical protein
LPDISVSFALSQLLAALAFVGSFQKNVVVVRLLMAVGATAWIIHNLLVGSPVAVLMELAFLGSNLVGYVRSRKYAGN